MTNERKITRRTALKGLALTAGALAVPKVAETLEYQPSLEESLARLPSLGNYEDFTKLPVIEKAKITFKDIDSDDEEYLNEVLGYVHGRKILYSFNGESHVPRQTILFRTSERYGSQSILNTGRSSVHCVSLDKIVGYKRLKQNEELLQINEDIFRKITGNMLAEE